MGESGQFVSELANLHFCFSPLYIFSYQLVLAPKLLLSIHAELSMTLPFLLKYVLKMVFFGSKERTKEPKLECACFLGQTS